MLQGRLLIVKDGQALERENLGFRHNKENRKKYLMCWKESVYTKHIMGLQTTVIGNTLNSPKCNAVPEGNHPCTPGKEKKLLQLFPAKEPGML